MTPRLIVGVLAFGLATTGTVVANLCAHAMIGEINRKRPKGEKVSVFFIRGKSGQIFDEYRRLYPAGKLHVYAQGATAVAIVSLVGCAVCLGFFG